MSTSSLANEQTKTVQNGIIIGSRYDILIRPHQQMIGYIKSK